MRIIDRILLVLFSLGSLCLTALMCLYVIGVFGNGSAALNLIMDYPNNLWLLVVGIVIFLLALRFLFYRWGRRDVDYVMLPSEYGGIRISFDTIRQLSNRTGKTIRGVQDFDTKVRSGQAGIVLSTRVRALPDLDLAHMSTEVQASVKEYVERTSGVSVERIVVNVVELASGAKSQRAWVE